MRQIQTHTVPAQLYFVYLSMVTVSPSKSAISAIWMCRVSYILRWHREKCKYFSRIERWMGSMDRLVYMVFGRMYKCHPFFWTNGGIWLLLDSSCVGVEKKIFLDAILDVFVPQWTSMAYGFGWTSCMPQIDLAGMFLCMALQCN